MVRFEAGIVGISSEPAEAPVLEERAVMICAAHGERTGKIWFAITQSSIVSGPHGYSERNSPGYYPAPVSTPVLVRMCRSSIIA